MRYRRFEPLDRDLSVLVLGTRVYRHAAPEVSTELLDAWLELGGNVVDSGREYGESERVLGRWLAANGRRDDVVVLTKGAHPDGPTPRLTPRDIADDLATSLEVLGTPSVDIYMLHRDDPAQPVDGVVEALNDHRRAGRILTFGASNWSTARLAAANAYARTRGLEGFSCSSPGLSLARQRQPAWAGCIAADDAPSRAWYEASGLPMFPWSAQAGGFFAGTDDPHTARVYRSDENLERLRRAERLGDRIGHGANEVALAWVLALPFPVYAVIGPRTVDELRRSVGALEIELTPGQLRWLNLEGDTDAA